MSFTKPVDIIFVGNTGSGKSTIIASLSKNDTFQRGVSFGTGKTQFLNFKEDKRPGYNWIRWADTPGLADVKIMKQAAKEISGALKKSSESGRETILIFVCTLQGGRVRIEDINTISCVVESIQLADGKPLPSNKYSILYNQVSKNMMKREDWVNGRVIIQEHFSTKTEYFPVTTNNFIYIQKFSELEDADDALFTDEQLGEMRLYERVFFCPRIRIENVEEIDVNKLMDPELIKNIRKEQEEIRQQLLKDFEAQFEKAEIIRGIFMGTPLAQRFIICQGV